MFSKPRGKTSIEMNRFLITPTAAQTALDHSSVSNFPQRQLSLGTVDNYAKEMLNETWHKDTGDVIRLTEHDGGYAVVDGQHRLAAIVKSGVAQEMWVATGVPEGAFKYLDQGKPRTLNHVMFSAGWPSPTVLAATGRFLCMHDTGIIGLFNKGSTESAGTMFDRIKKQYPDLRMLWESYGKMVSRAAKRSSLSQQAMYLAFYLAEKEDHDSTIYMFSYLSDSYETEPRDKVFRLMLGRLDQNSAEFRKAKELGREVRVEVRTADQFQVIRFAWLCHKAKINHNPKKLTGFNTSHNAWVSNGGAASPWAF